MTKDIIAQKTRNFNHITLPERKLIEKWLDEGIPKTEIAKRLGISRSTLYKEIERGTVTQLNYDLEPYEKYFAETGQLIYEEHRKNCKKSYKLVEAEEFIKDVEDEIINNKLSPDTAVGKLKRKKKYKTTVCTKTIYNYIDLGLLKVKNIDLCLKVKIKHKKKRVRANKRKLGESIENRPEEINNRTEFGHWEIDTVVGCRGSKSVLLTLDERKTRKRIIVKIPDKTSSSVIKALQKILEKNKTNAHKIFKSITSDNGSEFVHLGEISDNIKIYYAHAYSSYERGTNEKQNSLIRRFCPKGTNFDKVSTEILAKIEDWINELPRKMFDYVTSNEMFEQEIGIFENIALS